MKLFRATAKHYDYDYDYDEYDAFIIWANNAQEAIEIAIKNSISFYGESNFNDAVVEEVNEPNEPQILLGSFNAG